MAGKSQQTTILGVFRRLSLPPSVLAQFKPLVEAVATVSMFVLVLVSLASSAFNPPKQSWDLGD